LEKSQLPGFEPLTYRLCSSENDEVERGAGDKIVRHHIRRSSATHEAIRLLNEACRKGQARSKEHEK